MGDTVKYATVVPISGVDKLKAITTKGEIAILTVINGNVVFVEGIYDYLYNSFLGSVVAEVDVAAFLKNIRKYVPSSFSDAKNKLQLALYNANKSEAPVEPTDEQVCVFLALLQYVTDKDNNKVFKVDENGNVTVVGNINDSNKFHIGDSVEDMGGSVSITSTESDGTVNYSWTGVTKKSKFILQSTLDEVVWTNVKMMDLEDAGTDNYKDDNAVGKNAFYRIISADGTVVSTIVQDYYGNNYGLGVGII